MREFSVNPNFHRPDRSSRVEGSSGTPERWKPAKGMLFRDMSSLVGVLARSLRKGRKAASARDWRSATAYYMRAAETLKGTGPIGARIKGLAERMRELAEHPPEKPKPLA